MRLRQRSGITGPNGASLEYPLSTAQFIAPLKNTLIPSAGYGPATFTRSTTATVFDNEGILKEVRAGAARFTGARRVANSCPSSENFNGFSLNQSTAVAYSGALPPNVASAISLVANSTNNAHYASISLFWTGKNQVFSCYVKAGTISKVLIANASFARGVFFNLNTGTVEGTIGSLTSTITAVNDGWFKLTVAHTSGGANTFSISGYITYTGDFVSTWTYQLDGGSIHVTGMQMEDVTGQSDQTPSEYVHSGRVRPNYLTYTEDFTSSVWSNTNTTVTQNSIANPIDGRVNATKLQATSTSATLMSQNVVATGSTQTLSFYMKQGSGVAEANSFGIYNLTTLNWVVNASLNYSTKVVTISNGSGTINVTDVGSGWLLVNVTISGVTIGNSLSARIGFVNNSETSGVFCYVYGPSLVIDSSSTSYTPVGADYDPHGSGADGVKYFNTNKDGTPIPSGYIKGYLNEGARTNNLLWCRDLTNAAWVKTNMTTALTSTGIDGQASASTRLTATAGNATVVQTVTMSAGAKTFSAYVKRITGTGTVNITRDNGASWTDITSLLSTSAYTRVVIANTSIINPTCGFQIVTSGDAIDVDYCQVEVGSFPSNPIATTTVVVTRAADLLYYGGAGNVSDTVGTALCNYSTKETATAYVVQMYALSLNLSGRVIYENSTFSLGQTRIYDGTASVFSIGFLRNLDQMRKACSSWGGSTMDIITEGALDVSSTTFDGSMGSTTYLIVGAGDTTGSGVLYGNIKDVYMWATKLTANQMRQIVA